jgi:hypothetical protein
MYASPKACSVRIDTATREKWGGGAGEALVQMCEVLLTKAMVFCCCWSHEQEVVTQAIEVVRG